MSITRLTLSVNKDIAEQAKRLAKANKTSVSAMFSRFVRSAVGEPDGILKIGPLTRQVSGIVQLPPGRDYQELLTDALEKEIRDREVNDSPTRTCRWTH